MPAAQRRRAALIPARTLAARCSLAGLGQIFVPPCDGQPVRATRVTLQSVWAGAGGCLEKVSGVRLRGANALLKGSRCF